MANVARFASQSAIIFGMRLSGAALTFLVQAAMARMWGAELLGKYLLLIATVNLISVTMPLGFQVIGSYFAAEYRAAGNVRTLQAFALRSYMHVGFVFGAAMVVGSLFENHLGQLLQLPSDILLPGLIMAAATAIVFVNGSLLAGVKYPIGGFMADALLKPVVMVAGFVMASTLVEFDHRLSTLVWVGALAYLVVALLQAGFVAKAISRIEATTSEAAGETRRWWRFALPWIVICLATDFFFDIDLLLLSRSMSLEELAVFGVCVRIFSLIAFGVTTVYAVAMPDILEAQRQSQRESFHRKMTDANLIAGGVAACAGCTMLFSGPVLSLFGPNFAAGAVPLAILCAGLTARSIIGPSALVLSLHDKPYASLLPVAVGMFILVVANHILVPRFGMIGAASAASLAITIWSVAQWGVALKHTGTDVSIWPRVRAVFARPSLSRG